MACASFQHEDFANAFDPVDPRYPEQVYAEIRLITQSLFPDFDTDVLNDIFSDVLSLFNGDFPGYRHCNTEYHDLEHTIGVTLATARLIHGYCLTNGVIASRSALLGLIGALMHDTGYIQSSGDTAGTGAKFTLSHVSRSVFFMEDYFREYGFSKEDAAFCKKCILITNTNMSVDDLAFGSGEERLMAEFVGTADLLSQMADRNYLEKLVLLYIEFDEGKVRGFESEFDLLKGTIGFHNVVKERFTMLRNADRYMAPHFEERWHTPVDIYDVSIRKNIAYLEYILDNYDRNYFDHLRRDGIIQRIIANGMLQSQPR